MGLGTRVVLALSVIGAWLVFSKKSRASGPPTVAPEPGDVIELNAVASFYGPGFHGRQTASGEIFDQNDLTAAMRKPMAFGTRVRVTDLDSGLSVVVRINDRGPFTRNASGEFARSIDLSVGAAAAIGLDIQRGLARVMLERV